MTPQQHLLPQAQLNPVHPGQSFSYYDNMGPMLSQAPGQFGRVRYCMRVLTQRLSLMFVCLESELD